MTTTGAEMRRRRSHLSNGARTAVGHGRRPTGAGINRPAPADSSGFLQEASTEPVRHVPADSTPTPSAISITRRPTPATLVSISTATTLAISITRRPTPATLVSISTATTLAMTITRRPTLAARVRCYRVMTSAALRRCSAAAVLASTVTSCSITMSTAMTITSVSQVRCCRAMTSALTQLRSRRQLRAHRRFRVFGAVLLAATV